MTKSSFNSKIELKNSGNLSLFFIGTGSAFTKKAYQTNLLVIKGNEHVLIDCGTLCPYALKNAYNTDLAEIKNLIITHPHADHIGGVEEIALVGKYISNNKTNLIVPKILEKKLWTESLRGGLQFSEDGKMTLLDYFTVTNPVKLKNTPFEMFETQLGTLNIKLFRTRHVTTSKTSLRNSQLSYGLLFDDKVLFTADTQFNPEQLNYLLENYNIDTIFHDCDISGYSIGVHATYKQLSALRPETKAKTYLCHYSDVYKLFDPKKDGFAGFAEAGVYYNF